MFQQEALKYMVRRLVDLGDREGLVALLSRRFPNGTVAGHALAEYYIAYFGRETLKDAILILGEAYAQCRIPKVRRTIANAVRRDFSGSGVRGKDDAEFVKNAMRWYEEEKEHLVVLERWPSPNMFSLGPYDVDDPHCTFTSGVNDWPPLFVDRAPPAKAKGK